MARNRKHQSAAIRFGPAVKALLLCLMFGGSGVGYVWQKNQIYDLGLAIRKREHQLAAMKDQNEKLRKQLAMMVSPAYLERRIKELNLGLAPAQPDQIWRLREPVPATTPEAREREYASQQRLGAGDVGAIR